MHDEENGDDVHSLNSRQSKKLGVTKATKKPKKRHLMRGLSDFTNE